MRENIQESHFKHVFQKNCYKNARTTLKTFFSNSFILALFSHSLKPQQVGRLFFLSASPEFFGIKREKKYSRVHRA
jgi:hypothetical protein